VSIRVRPAVLVPGRPLVTRGQRSTQPSATARRGALREGCRGVRRCHRLGRCRATHLQASAWLSVAATGSLACCRSVICSPLAGAAVQLLGSPLAAHDLCDRAAAAYAVG
jgi:hypothetical protein